MVKRLQLIGSNILFNRHLKNSIFKSLCGFITSITILLFIWISFSLIMQANKAVYVWSVKLNIPSMVMNKFVGWDFDPQQIRQVLKLQMEKQNIPEQLYNQSFILRFIKSLKKIKKCTVTKHSITTKALKPLNYTIYFPLKPSHEIRLYLKSFKNKSPPKFLVRQFNRDFFTHYDSRYPSFAGIKGALIGSLWLLLIACIVALPLGIGVAVYIVELERKSILARLLDLNLTNLAAVPSIIFGVIGFGILINYFNLPRASILVGGITLGLLAFSTVCTTAKLAMNQIPKTVKYAAKSLGASKIQLILHYILPHSASGLITGIILAISRIIGESAPLILVGMTTFVYEKPTSIFDPTTALPVQIFSWFFASEEGFMEVASLGIICLLIILFSLNLVASFIRYKFNKNKKKYD